MLQVVCVSWGERYSPAVVDGMSRAVRRQCSRPVRFICISDRPPQAYAPEIEVLPFPRFARPFPTLGWGCFLKLSVFARGLLAPDLPTIYLDLDTLVRGDLAVLARELERHGGMLMLRNHLLPTWRLPPALCPGGYYFGNSSVLAFRPGEFTQLFDDFNDAATWKHAGRLPSRLRTDERFISHWARDRLRVFPASLAVKFAQEYISFWPAWQGLIARLPWVRRRRREQVVVTFVGEDFKPARLAAVRPGDVLRYKRRRVRWSTPEFSEYFQSVLERGLR